jgi:hypothetical protein
MKLRRALLAAVAVLVGAGATASAATFQIGSFESASGNYTYANATGTLTGTTSGSFTVDPEAFTAITGLPAPVAFGASLTVDATRTAAAFGAGPNVFQAMDGSFTVRRTSDNALVLRADFTGGFLGGQNGGNVADLGAISPLNGATVTYTSDFFDGSLLIDPKAVTFALNPLTVVGGLHIGGGGNFASFTAPDTANFSASLNVPEPVSMSLLGMGLLGVAMARRRRSS